MIKKRILIISGAFFPQNSPRSFRTTELSKELSRQGHEVVVYIPKNNYNYSDFEKEFHLVVNDIGPFKFIPIEINGSQIIRLLRRILQRACLLLFEYPAIEYLFRIVRVLKNEKGYDAIISIAVPYPIHWGVARIIKRKPEIAKIWIADCGDPYMGCNRTANRFNRHPFYFKFIEKKCFRRTNFITIPIENAKEGYYQEFHNKIIIIPQGFNFDEFKREEKFIKNNIVTFAYAGGFIPGFRDPRPFLDYLSSLNISFKFYIYTTNEGQNLIKEYIEKLGGKLEIFPYLPRLKLLENLCKMDFLVNFENSDNIQSPSKLIDYALTKRPILSVGTRDIHMDIIKEFLERDYSNQTVVDNIEQYNIKNVADSFLSLFQ